MAVATKQRQDLLPVEDRIDRLQRPILVEDDLILEQPWSVKQDSVMMEEFE